MARPDDCPQCGHSPSSAGSGVCGVVASTTGSGQDATMMTNVHEDGSPCGCTFLGTNSTCVTCGRAFLCTSSDVGSPAHPPHDCYSCYYSGAMEQARREFEPLSKPLERLLEVETHVDQTGGMVMCLAVPLPNKHYAWFSELDGPSDGAEGEEAAFGVYYWSDEPQPYGDDGGGARWVSTSDLPYDADHAEQVAEWAAPLLAQVADQAARGVSIRDMTVGEFHES